MISKGFLCFFSAEALVKCFVAFGLEGVLMRFLSALILASGLLMAGDALNTKVGPARLGLSISNPDNTHG